MVDLKAPVTLQAAEGLLDLPPARLDREASLVLAPDQLERNAVALQRGRGALAGEGEVGPDLAQMPRCQLGPDQGRRVAVLYRRGHDAQRRDEARAVGQEHALVLVRVVAARAGLGAGAHALGVEDAGRGPPV